MRYVRTVDPKQARGLVARVYRQIRRDFGLVTAPMAVHSPLPELLAGAWSSLREIVLVGRVPRVRKEAVAAAVSRANACPYCVDAHTLMLGAAGEGGAARALRSDHRWPRDPVLRSYAEWGAATRTPGDPRLADPPFLPEDAPELLGTVACFHYVNRMMTAVGEESPLPPAVRGWRKPIGAWVASRKLRPAYRASREPEESFPLVPAAELPGAMAWARPDRRVEGALGRWWYGLTRSAEAHLPATVVAWSRDHLASWDGTDPPFGSTWIDDATAGLGEDRPAGRMILLAALAPHRITEGEVAAFQVRLGGSAALVAALAWGAGLASMGICGWSEPRVARTRATG